MVEPDFSQPPRAPGAPEDTAWTEPVPPRHLLRVEIVTDSRRVIGAAQHPTAARLVDLLNWTNEPALALTDVEVAALEGQGEAPHRWPQAHVAMQAIAFAIPHEEESIAVVRRPLEHVEKRPWRVSALLPRFTVTGCFHLAPAADPANASLFWNSGFVPLTDAEAIFLPEPTTTWKAAVIIVNTARVETYCPPAALAAE